MLEKPSHELHGIKSHGAPPVTVGFTVAEEDPMMLHFHNAMIGNGHLENIGSQILQAGMAFTPDVSPDARRQTGSGHDQRQTQTGSASADATQSQTQTADGVGPR